MRRVNTIVIHPLNLDSETCQLLANVLLSQQRDGVLLRRNQLITVGSTIVKLSNDILIRRKGEHAWRFDIMDDKSCGQGKFGSAHAVIGKISISAPVDGVATMVVERKNHRVYKLQNNAALKEFKLMNRCSHLRTRGLFPGVPSLISMRKFEGEVLNQALNRDRSFNSLSLTERFKITIALLRALKIQMHDNMICHRDIKPDNIFYNPKTGEIMFFDLGTSQLIGDLSDKRSRGNATYSAPEDFISIRTGRPVSVGEIKAAVGRKSLLTPKSDIYSVARVLYLVWGDDDPIYFDKLSDPSELLCRRAALNWEVRPSLSSKSIRLPKEFFQKIASQLSKMTNLDPDLRPDLMSCIRSFEQLFLDYRLLDVPQELHSILNEAHFHGEECFWQLNNIDRFHNLQERLTRTLANLAISPETSLQSVRDILKRRSSKTANALALEIEQWHLENELDMTLPASDLLLSYGRDESIAQLLQTLIIAITELDDNSVAVREFRDTLGMQCMVGVESRLGLHETVIDIISTYQNRYNEVMKLYTSAQAENNAAILAEMKHFILTLSTYRLNLDEIYQASLHMGRKLDKLVESARTALNNLL